MAVFEFLEWCRRLPTVRSVAVGQPPVAPPETGATEQDGPVCPDTCPDDVLLEAYASRQRAWDEALAEAERARVEDAAQQRSTRLLLGTAIGSVLLFGVAVSTRVAPGVVPDALTPLTMTVLGALGAALVTALAAGVGKALRRRSTTAAEPPAVSDPVNPVGEPPAESGPGRAGGP